MMNCNKCGNALPLFYMGKCCPECGDNLKEQEENSLPKMSPFSTQYDVDPWGTVNLGRFIGASGSVANLASHQENDLKQIADDVSNAFKEISSVKNSIPQDLEPKMKVLTERLKKTEEKLKNTHETIEKTQNENKQMKETVKNLTKGLTNASIVIHNHLTQTGISMNLNFINESAIDLLNDINENPTNYNFIDEDIAELKGLLVGITEAGIDGINDKSKPLLLKIAEKLKIKEILNVAGPYLPIFISALKTSSLI